MAIQVVCDFCKAEYNLKDDLAGKKLRCKKCEQVRRREQRQRA